MKTGAAVIGMVVTAGIGLAVGYAVREGRQGGEPVAAKKAEADRAAPSPSGGAPAADVFRVPVGKSVQKGPQDALVTIVEFSDFQCPFCSRVNPTIAQIQKTYGDKVRVVFKHNPLPFHRDAPLASEYALAAGEQGKFWEMHDKLFANQKQLKPDDLKRYASELGLDQAKIDAYISSGEGKKMIKSDQTLARSIGATGTPSFFINGVKLSGAQPFPAFQKVIDERLAAANALVKDGVPAKKVYAELTKNGRTTPPAKAPQKAKPADTRQKVELVSTTPMKGGKQPLVYIVEFSDFQCPFCSRVNPTLKQVQDTYGDKVQIRFRNQPLSFHKDALPAAKAALAAGKQGKFWEMHDKLFANQKALKPDDFKKYAEEIGLNVAKFEKDLTSSDIAKQIAKDQADASKYGARGTPTLFVNGVPVRGAQAFPAFKAVIDKEIELANKLMKEGVKKKDVYAEILKREAGKTVGGAKPQAAAPPKPTGPVDVEIGRAPTQGKKNAPVKVILYSDFECPFCGRVNPSIEQIKKEYGDKVVVAFKNYPLPFHRNAKPAAIASLAAHRQGKFWEMHDKLFENQKALTPPDLEGYAKELGLDMGKFKKDMADPALAKWVDQDMAEGAKIGVRGTPATFINGRMVSGAQPYQSFKSIIDAELGNS